MPSLAWLLTSALAATAASAASSPPARPLKKAPPHFTYALVAQRATLTNSTLTLHVPFPYALWWTSGGDAAGAGMFDANYLLSSAYVPPSPPNTDWMSAPPVVLVAGGQPVTANLNAHPTDAFKGAGDDDEAVVLRVAAPRVLADGDIVFTVRPADNDTVDSSEVAHNFAAAVGSGGDVPTLNLTNVALVIDDVAGLVPAAPPASSLANCGRRLAQAGLARAIRGSPDPQAAAQGEER